MKIKLWQWEYDFDKEDAKIVVPLILLVLGLSLTPLRKEAIWGGAVAYYLFGTKNLEAMRRAGSLLPFAASGRDYISSEMRVPCKGFDLRMARMGDMGCVVCPVKSDHCGMLQSATRAASLSCREVNENPRDDLKYQETYPCTAPLLPEPFSL